MSAKVIGEVAQKVIELLAAYEVSRVVSRSPGFEAFLPRYLESLSKRERTLIQFYDAACASTAETVAATIGKGGGR